MKSDPAVVEFIDDLAPRLKKQVKAIRKVILAVSPDVSEGLKWNVPSFRTSDWFATFNLRGTTVRLVLHTGAKVKQAKIAAIEDPDGLLEWLGMDRCLITFADEKDVKAKLPALERLMTEWIRRL